MGTQRCRGEEGGWRLPLGIEVVLAKPSELH